MKRSSIGYTAAGNLRAPWRLAVFVMLMTVFGIISALIVAPQLRQFHTAGAWRAETLASVVDVLATLAATWIALRWVDKKGLAEVGLDRTAAEPKRVIGGFLLGGGAIAIAITVLIIAGWLRSTPSASPLGHPIVNLTMLLIPAALAEELLTRGYILTVLRDAWGWPAAVLVTSVAFGLLHLRNAGADVQSVALVTLAGVFLAVIRIVTGSLYAAWAAHFAWNWVMAGLFHAAVSGIAFDAPGYRYVDAGPDWATGGIWGPEGGIPAGLMMIAGIGLLLARRRRRAEENG
jgi:membrane protease YdiL (CAAX protease family)